MKSVEFNRLAEQIGCKARITGNKRIKFFEFSGNYINGYEIIYPITSEKFSVLISNYPQLQND